ncbi:MAG: hypothetical protein IKB02_00745 [Clostridia bacterium]|nr:hypothetical protein [Clostridia bacterium]
MKKIYILLSSTGTIPAKAVRLFTRRKFSHVSIALVPSVEKFYSYARRKIHNPLIGGLVEENTNSGVFGLFPDSNCELLELEVSDKVYDDIVKIIDFYFENYEKCTYKFSALVPMALGIEQKLKFKMTCSQFVAMLLEKTGACTLPRHSSLMRPCDFLEIEGAKSIFKGALRDLHFEKQLQETK